jgi:hypothetical protein
MVDSSAPAVSMKLKPVAKLGCDGWIASDDEGSSNEIGPGMVPVEETKLAAYR